jgi:hypothetical protein
LHLTVYRLALYDASQRIVPSLHSTAILRQHLIIKGSQITLFYCIGGTIDDEVDDEIDEDEIDDMNRTDELQASSSRRLCSGLGQRGQEGESREAGQKLVGSAKPNQDNKIVIYRLKESPKKNFGRSYLKTMQILGNLSTLKRAFKNCIV